jgi:AcrR family transcriptional regulator
MTATATATTPPRATTEPRARILRAAARALASDSRASVAAIADDARTSRATVYRYFPSRSELLAALDLEPDPATRDRVLGAAAELVGRDGLRNLSMDELAAAAGVSRASVYRLFPGKTALFSALILEYSPFHAVEATLERLADRPPAEVLPEVARVAARTVAPRIGIARSLMFEITSGDPEAVAAAEPVLRQLFGSLGGYVARQMAAGTLRPMHPLLAVQALIGPVFFHLFTRPVVGPIAHFELPLEDAVTALATAAVDGLMTMPAAEETR